MSDGSESGPEVRDEGDANGRSESDETPAPETDIVVETTTHEAPDGTPLSIRTFRPAGSGPDDPAPVLLQRTPYGTPESLSGRSLAAPAVDRGYAVAYEDTRGRGESGGAFRPWVHEGRDGAATVEWLADRPWSDGRVGAFGGSSPGHVQLFAAAERPAGLRAIAPMFAPADLHRSDFFQDGAMSALTLVTWSLDDSVAGHTVDRLERAGRLDAETAAAARDALQDALESVGDLVAHRPLADLPARVLDGVDLPDGVAPGDLVPHWEAWTSRPTYDAFWRSFDPEVSYDRIAVPGLHVTGWYELCQNGTLTNFRGLRAAADAPQHLVVGPWAHQDVSGAPGALDFGAGAADYGIWETHLAFFDTYVRGEPRAPFAGDGRLVETFRMTVTGDEPVGGGAWASERDWPPADTTRERWYLHSDGAATDPGDGRLTRASPHKFEPADTWTHDPTDPVPTRGGPLCCGHATPAAGPVDQRPVERRPDVCTYTTPPLDRRLELAGPVSARLAVATDAPDTDFAAKLVHVTDAGPAYNLCEGIRRARYRHGRDREVPVPEGEPMRVVVDLWDVHHAVPAGDRIRLEVASSNHPRFDPHPGTRSPWRATDDEVVAAEQTLYHERDRESALTITRR